MSKKTHEAALAFVDQTKVAWAGSSLHVGRLQAREVDLKLSSGAKAVFLTNIFTNDGRKCPDLWINTSHKACSHTRPDSLPVCTDPVEFRSGESQVVS